MIERIDIDALLIGALYGELTPADEARLSAHLESHPADRSALDGMRTTRQAVLESRILAVQLDPPQSISALLLQEAARRAPKVAVAKPEREEGWFARFVNSFARHPAMAAAAMLVVVVGVGGLLYSRKGNQFAEQTVDSRAEIVAAGSAAAAPAEEKPGVSNDLLKKDTGTDSFRVDLVDQNAKAPEKKLEGGIEVHTPDPTVKDFPADDKVDAKKVELAKNVEQQQAKGQVAFEAKKKSVPAGKPVTKTSVESLDEEDTIAMQRQGYANAVTGAGTSAGSGSPMPPQVATTAPRNEKETTGAKPEPPKQEAKQDPSLLAWAKDQHTRAQALAAKGQCAEAGKLAAQISTRAPEYYNASVVSDRALKQCTAYINAERERDAEKANKSRAQKRLDANEPSPALDSK